MRVLFWCPAFWPEIGGVQSFAAALLPALQEHGYQFAVVTGGSDDGNNAADYKGIPIYRFPFHHLTSYKDIDRLMALRRHVLELKRAFSADLVHINSVDLSLLFHLMTASPGTPSLVTLHGNWPTRDGTSNALVEKLLGTADWVVGCSEGVLKDGRQLVPGLKSRSSVVYNGLTLPAVKPTPLPVVQPRLLCLGRLSQEKRIEVAIRAFDSVVRRFPTVRLVIAGDGPERSALEQLVLRLDLTDSVEFIGWVTPSRVPELINTAMAVLMPSKHEGFPLAALEAAFMGRPLIATRVGGLSEVVQHEETGLLIDPGAAEGLASAISCLLADPARAIRFGQAARRWAQNFSLDRSVKGYDALYRKLIRNREGRL
jgi:glycogen(starch) synthase